MPKNINKKHNFKHLEKVYKNPSEEITNTKDVKASKNTFLDSIPLGGLIIKDLKRSVVLITIIIILIIILGIVMYRTDLLSSILEKFSLRY